MEVEAKPASLAKRIAAFHLQDLSKATITPKTKTGKITPI
jgi:hypothetical protein